MKREGTIGAVAFLAIAGAVGFSLQSGPKPQESGRAERNSLGKRSKPSLGKNVTYEDLPGCASLREPLEDFLEIENLIPPESCLEKDDPRRKQQQQDLTKNSSKLKFVIALLPDPVHTHSSVLFDQFTMAIQEGAQDERYDFDGSWLPWDDDETPYARFPDEKASNLEQDIRETQPGIILFRKTVDCGKKDSDEQKECRDDWEKGGLSKGYREGLVIFVVGEDATHGIHKDQFRNALEWIKALRPKTDTQGKPPAILGPTFSGSLASLTQVLSEPKIRGQLNLSGTQGKTTEPWGTGKNLDSQRLAIYSGSVSGYDSAQAFQASAGTQVVFHSFLQNDDEIFRRFCAYVKDGQNRFDVRRIAVISEDETAYGKSGVNSGDNEGRKEEKDPRDVCRDGALKLYYPRDISALRGAYQTKSLFDGGTPAQPAGTQAKSLPTDLADPSGKVHDSIPSYSGNQTPLTQEAFLMEIAAALRELHARYIVLRSSSTLDQLFLSDFLRRSYPDARIVIFNSDLMFMRERGATGLSGTMTLSTYPLFPLERDWTEHQSLPATDRVFSGDGMEGTYVALRLLLNEKSLNDGSPAPDGCHVILGADGKDEAPIFVPRIACTKDPPIPDYSAPFWMVPDQCGEMTKRNNGEECPYPEPATWLSVIGVNRFWPIAALTKEPPDASPTRQGTTEPAERAKYRERETGGRPEMPLEMKVFFLVLAGFSVFHFFCCWSGSYTAKPAFRAHFATTGDWRHTLLVTSGSCSVAFLAIVAGWGSGVFAIPASGLAYPWVPLCCMFLICLMAYAAILANIRNSRQLSKDLPSRSNLRRKTGRDSTIWNYWASGLFFAGIVLFYLSVVAFTEQTLPPNDRALTYWRAMHLASGVSPIVPLFSILIGLYLSFWYALHGLALFGPDRPRLPLKGRLILKDRNGKELDLLRMFSQEDAGAKIERAAMPLTSRMKFVAIGLLLSVLFVAVPSIISEGIPVRSLGSSERYSIIFLVGLDLCCSLALVQALRLYKAWEELRRLLEFLDRLPLRRTLAVLHGFSWGSVWKMSGNVLEVRYEVISRQMECMNHTITSLQELLKKSSDPAEVEGVLSSLNALVGMRNTGMTFAEWYSTNYTISHAGDLTSFRKFQKSIAAASGTLLTKLLVPAWRKQKGSLLAIPLKEEKDEATPNPPPQAKEKHIRNAEEFVCLNYLGFVQNILGRLRTMAITIVLLFLAAAFAISSYPFDPRQALSGILIALFFIVGAVIVKVYAEMHRDATLSYVTDTKPGELGTEFWFKILGFGAAPAIALLTRVFPSMADFLFSWVQPGISSLK
jgi:hypothetical protein